MPNLYAETENVLLFIDFKKYSSPFRIDDGIYSLLFVPLNSSLPPLITTLIIKNNYPENNKFYKVANINDDIYLYYKVEDTNDYSPQPISYYQESFKLNELHYFTAYKQNSDSFITLECANEIFNLKTPGELKNITIKHERIDDCFLIIIKSDLKDKNYILIFIYDDDYHLIFSSLANKISIEENQICLTDYVYDSLQRKINRYFTFKDNKYVETKRSFSYNKTPPLLDKTIPYIFLEAIFVKDYEYANMLVHNNKLAYFLETIGEFEKIILIDSLYKDFRVYLLYNKDNRSTIKCFDFDIEFNQIKNITIVL